MRGIRNLAVYTIGFITRASDDGLCRPTRSSSACNIGYGVPGWAISHVSLQLSCMRRPGESTISDSGVLQNARFILNSVKHYTNRLARHKANCSILSIYAAADNNSANGVLDTVGQTRRSSPGPRRWQVAQTSGNGYSWRTDKELSYVFGGQDWGDFNFVISICGLMMKKGRCPGKVHGG